MSPKARVCKQGLPRWLLPPTHTLASEAPPTGLLSCRRHNRGPSPSLPILIVNKVFPGPLRLHPALPGQVPQSRRAWALPGAAPPHHACLSALLLGGGTLAQDLPQTEGLGGDRVPCCEPWGGNEPLLSLKASRSGPCQLCPLPPSPPSCPLRLPH